MTFTALQNFSTPPRRIVGAPRGNILEAFPPKPIDAHSRLGYNFRREPCNNVQDYDPDICATPGDAKMTPNTYAAADRDAELRIIQAAFMCSTVGATDAELRSFAEGPVERNLWRSVDAVLASVLDAEDVASGGPFSAAGVLAAAGQFLAASGYGGTGVIYGSTSWFLRLNREYLEYRDGRHYDMVGNIVIPSSSALTAVYAFDSEVEVRTSDILVMDEYAPDIRTRNDRVVRAEQVYTLAIDPCVVGSFTLSAIS